MLKTARVVGLNSDISAALALISTGEITLPLPPDRNEPQPHLFMIVSCQSEDAFSRTRQCLAEAEAAFYNTEAAIPQRLSEALREIQKTLADTEELEVLIASYQQDAAGSVLYLLCKNGPINAYLIRGDKQTNLCPQGNDYQLVSGVLEEGDRVVLATDSLINLMGAVAALGSFPIETWEDEVGSRLPEAENYPVAAIVLEREKSAILEKEEAADEIEPLAFDQSKPAFSLLRATGLLGRRFFRAVPRSKRGLALLGLALTLVVVGVMILGYQQKKESETLAEFNQNYQEALAEYNQAQSVKEWDIVAAASSLGRTRDLLEKALKIKPQDKQALDLKKQLEENRGGILKDYSVDQLPLWLDFDLIRKGLTAKNLSLSHGKLLVLDSSSKALLSVDLTTKSHQILAGADKLGNAQFATLNGETAWTFAKDLGIIQTDLKNSQTKTVIKPDDEWGNIKDIYGFAGNIYLLDSGDSSIVSGQIWKYIPIETGFAGRRAYFKAGTQANLGDATRLQIDSSVWVLKKGGEILKYTQGSPDYFSLSGLDKGINNPKSFFVSDETDNLYILDSGNNRLVVLDKKGIYKSQYQSDKFSSFSDLVVDEKGKRVYLLSGGKLFVMEFK